MARKITPSVYDEMMGKPKRHRAESMEFKLVSVKLDPPEVNELKAYADELGVSLHKILQYAIRSFIARYKRGERPRMVEKKVKDLAID
jgi:hypothetical protein